MQRLLSQFFDRRSWWALGAIAAVHAVAAVVIHSPWSWLTLAVIGVATFVISTRSLVSGLAIAMIEIFVGGHGHLITAEASGFSVGIRMVVFVAVMLAWLVLAIRGKVELRIVPWRDAPWALLALAVFMGSITGYFRNGFGPAFDDMNAYLTVGYLLPILSTVWTPEYKRVMLKAFFASAAWVAASTLVILYAFTHLPVAGIHASYGFLRDSRIAEITILSGPTWVIDLIPNGPWYFRVFEQGQFSVVAMELVLIAATLFVWRSERLPRSVVGLHALMLAAIIASLSRSFWLGFVGGLVALFVACLVDRVPFREWIRTKAVGVASGILALLALWVLVVLPLPPRPDLTNSPYYRGEEDETRELAVSSRWNLLGPMMEKIAEEPLWGSGFGTSVTFISDDPRVREINPSGEWTTYRFEWGFHDIWLKMGIPGIAAVVWFLGVCVYAGWRSVKQKREWRWLTLGLMAGIVALYTTHVFSPYLNHPIGIGFMLFVIPFLGWNRREDAMAEESVVQTKPVVMPMRPQVGVVTSDR